MPKSPKLMSPGERCQTGGYSTLWMPKKQPCLVTPLPDRKIILLENVRNVPMFNLKMYLRSRDFAGSSAPTKATGVALMNGEIIATTLFEENPDWRPHFEAEDGACSYATPVRRLDGPGVSDTGSCCPSGVAKSSHVLALPESGGDCLEERVFLN